MSILVTGAAGFIGNEVVRRLLEEGETVHALDNLNDYYEVSLKEARLQRLERHSNFRFEKLDLADAAGMRRFYDEAAPDLVIHLAAQAGVRYSLERPQAYVDSNVTGFLNILEACRHRKPRHLVYASSSSVYGLNSGMPYQPGHAVDHPISLYAATKRGNELMAHAYSHLFGIPVTGLRFFTVYGPWGRPDMALFKFTRRILAGETIDVFNHGKCLRDFTYIDDIVDGVLRVARGPVPVARSGTWEARPDRSAAPFRTYNIGNGSPVTVERFIEVLESALGARAKRHYLEAQAGDVESTFADVSDLVRDYGYRPSMPIETGVDRFVRWYREYYGN